MRSEPTRSTSSLAVTILLAGVAGLFAMPDWPEAHPAPGTQPRRPAGYTPFRYPRTPEQIWRDETAIVTVRAHAAEKDLQATIARGPFRGDHESIATHHVPEWFQDAKFGMFSEEEAAAFDRWLAGEPE